MESVVEQALLSDLSETVWGQSQYRSRLRVASADQYAVAHGAARMVLHEYFRLPTGRGVVEEAELSWLPIVESAIAT